MLAQHKRSREPGDNEAMVKSRQQFLNNGYYSDLSDLIASEVKALDAQQLLDIGCGEAYYLAQIKAANPALALAGIDISKFAVKLAGKRKLDATLAVASAFKLPFFDNTFDVAVSVFSPIDAEEAARVLKPGGHLIMVGPGEQHLHALAEQIYTQAQTHQGNKQALSDTPFFEHLYQRRIDRNIIVKGQDIFNLLTMTPYYWSATEAQQQAIKTLPELDTAISFNIDCYRATRSELLIK